MASRDEDLVAHVLELLEAEEEEEEEEEEEYLKAQLALCFLLGAEEHQRIATAMRKTCRRYLVRRNLLPDPRTSTPWQVLYKSQDSRAFITTMGVDILTFNLILNGGFRTEWDTSPIGRADVSTSGTPKLNRCSLTAEGALGLVLHYLSSTTRLVRLQQIFALVPTTVTRYLAFALRILHETLRSIPEGRIAWPKDEEFGVLSAAAEGKYARLTGAFGVIDGLNIPVQESNDPEIQNATYNGWLGGCYISSVIAYGFDGCIISCVYNAPGSWHDSRVAQPIYDQLLNDTPDGYFLVADTAFPRGNKNIDGRIQAPLKENQSFSGEEQLRFNEQLVMCRQAAEWGMRAIQGAFGRLRLPLDINDPKGRGDLLETCFRLHNVRTRMMGVNQIQTVFMPIWWDLEDARMEELDVFRNFDLLVNGTRGRSDRIAQFYYGGSG